MPPLLLLALAFAEEPEVSCPQPVTAVELQATLSALELAYGASDSEAIAATASRAKAELPCVREEITPSLAAKMHRGVGLEALASGHRDESLAAFAAARAIEPKYRFPESVAAPGSPTFDQYVAADPTGRFELAPLPKRGKLLIDGLATQERPLDAPAVVQVLDRTGDQGSTTYLWPDQPIPYDARSMRSPTKTALLVGGAAATVLGAAGLVAGLTLPPGDGPRTQLQQARLRSTLQATSLGLLAAGTTGLALTFAIPNGRGTR